MSDFNVAGEDLDRIFFTEQELLDRYVTGVAYSFGYNGVGELGDNTSTNRSSPIIVKGGIVWKQIACGRNHSAGISVDGILWTWGYNNNGQLGDGSITNRSSPGSTSGGGTTWLYVTGGDFHTTAIKTDGTLWSCGYNLYGQLGDGTTTSRTSPVTTAGGGTNWKQAACGMFHTVAIKTDGTLWTWGYSSGLGVSSADRSSPGTTAGGGTTWKQAVAAAHFSGAIKTDGTLWTWGVTTQGGLGAGATTSRSSPGTTAGGGTTWKQVSAMYLNMAAVKTDGTLWTWGDNTTYGQLGNGNTTDRNSPGTTSGGGTTWKQVACGYSHMAAVKTDGTLWTWGSNSVGALGTGDTTDRSSPGLIAGASNWKQVDAAVMTLGLTS